MEDGIFKFFSMCIFLLIISLIVIIVEKFNQDESRKKRFVKKMMKKISKFGYDTEFERVYQNIINSNDIKKHKNEHRNQLLKSFLGIILIIAATIAIPYLFINFRVIIKDGILGVIIVCVALVGYVPAAILFCRKKEATYKELIVKKLINDIDFNIRYDDTKNDISKIRELYLEAGYKDREVNEKYVTDYMEYNLENDVTVKLADLHLEHIKRSTYKHRYSVTYKVYEGIATKVTRKNTIGNSILIQRNKAYKSYARIGMKNKIMNELCMRRLYDLENTTTNESGKENIRRFCEEHIIISEVFKEKKRIEDDNKEFEKIFDLYVEDTNGVDLIVTEYVKNELIKLYEEYGIMFEISIRNNNIYIRFFTGDLFETKKLALAAINKKKLYKEYVIFKAVLEMIKRINELFIENIELDRYSE